MNPHFYGVDATLAIRNGEIGSQYQKMPILALKSSLYDKYLHGGRTENRNKQ